MMIVAAADFFSTAPDDTFVPNQLGKKNERSGPHHCMWETKRLDTRQ
jgi:hypothetical protein